MLYVVVLRCLSFVVGCLLFLVFQGLWVVRCLMFVVWSLSVVVVCCVLCVV